MENLFKSEIEKNTIKMENRNKIQNNLQTTNTRHASQQNAYEINTHYNQSQTKWGVPPKLTQHAVVCGLHRLAQSTPRTLQANCRMEQNQWSLFGKWFYRFSATFNRSRDNAVIKSQHSHNAEQPKHHIHS